MYLVPVLLKVEATRALIAEQTAHALVGGEHVVIVGAARQMDERRAARTSFDLVVLADNVELPAVD